MATKQNQRILGLLFLSIAMIAVGTTVVASKLISGGLPPFTATAMRFAIASPAFLLLFFVTGQKVPLLSKHDWIILVVQAGLGSVGYTVFLIHGVSFTTGANASVIVGTLPIVMGVLAIMMFGEALTYRFVCSLLIATFGVLLLTFQTSAAELTPNKMALIGAGFIFLAVICEAFFMLLNKKLHAQLPAMVQAGLMSGLGLAIALLPASYEVANGMVTSIEPIVILSVAYYAIIPTLIGSTFWYAGTLRTTAGEAALTTAIMPISALILSDLVLEEAINLQQTIGCIFVVCAVLAGVQKTRPQNAAQ